MAPKKNAETEQTEAQKKAKAYGAATARLKDAHRPEWLGLVAEEMSSLGIEWSPRPTPEERAAQQMAALIAEFPGLAPQN